MTTSPEPADDNQFPPNDGTPAQDQPSASESANSASTEQPENLEEGLPEWEPLTPELVEDEAIRGDFVIRWAVVGLALLFGFAPITDTRTLVHLKSGEHLASHGFLPAANDVFSYTASDRRWVNLSWLYDLVATGVHSLAGGIGLSILQAVLAAITFGLVANTYHREIRSWWGSICAGLALLVCYPQFTSQPELVSLVGIAAILWLVLRAEESRQPRYLWSTVAVVWVWSQFDIRAFLGWLLLISFALGETLRKGDDAKSRRGLAWRVALAAFAVCVIHPFLWETWLSPVRLFAMDYPALRQVFPKPGAVEVGFYPITFPVFWTSINHGSIAAIVLFVATTVSLFLNRERLHPGHVIAVLVFNLLAGLATHELAAASLVNCVVCTLNAQSWYRHRFGQVYSIHWRELLFSRGGRAVTVLCYFVLAWLVISGRIDGPAGRRTGMGFHENLQVQMDSYRQIVTDDGKPRMLDDRPFHFVARQGDLLIWTGQKSFIDTRAALFAGSSERDLIGLHDRTRRAMQQKRNLVGSGEPDVWKATFAKYQLTHTIPRLSGPIPAPDYISFGDLLANNTDWALTDLTASAAVFYHVSNQPAVNEFIAQHRIDFVKLAFQAATKPEETVRVCAKGATLSDSIFSLRRPRYPAGIQLAAHYLQLSGAAGNISPQIRAACATLAVRSATEGLRDDSNSADGYRMLGLAYQILDRIESNIMTQAGTRWFSSVRYNETLAALQQAALLSPDDALARGDLFGLFERNQRGDLALDAIRHIKRIRGPITAKSSEADRNQRTQLVNSELALEETLAKIEAHVKQQLEGGADRFQTAATAYQAGAVLLAIRTLEEEPIYVEENPLAKNALGTWLIEAGRIQEGLNTLEQVSSQRGIPGWRDAMAASVLVNANYSLAQELWTEQLDESVSGGTQRLLQSLPFVTLGPGWMGTEQYPFVHVAAAEEMVGRFRAEAAALKFQIAQAQLELGDVAGAKASLQSLMESQPTSPIRPLVKFYLESLTGKKIEDPTVEALVQEEFDSLEQ